MKKRSINIKSKIEIQELFRKGSLIRLEGINVFYEVTNLAISRILVTFPRIFKGAVKRNRVRRVLKECFRRQYALLRSGWCIDFIFVVYPQKANVSYCEFETVLRNVDLAIIKRKV